MQLICHRDQPEPTYTGGLLYVPGRTVPFFTIELPWNDNEPDASCVPYATFQMIPYFSPKHQHWTWCLHNPEVGVWAFPSLGATFGLEQYVKPDDLDGRACCEFHAANQAWQLLGCVAPGLTRTMMDIGKGMQPSVGSSQVAFSMLCSLLAPNGDIRHAVGHSIDFVASYSPTN